MRLPDATHPITVEPSTAKVLVKSGDKVLADTTHALALKEASYPSVMYIPRSDARMDLLERSDHKTYCPYKGECSYYSVVLGGFRLENAVWTYEDPYPAVASIKDHLAFYPDQIEIEQFPS